MTRSLFATLALALLFGAAPLAFEGRNGASALGFALSAGAVFGFVLQRTRFCFYCHARDWFEARDPRGLLAILLAIAVGLVGYTVIVSSWLPTPVPGRLPPDLHIGPVSWVLVVAAVAFGLGMLISGSCLSAHWYRLAEGSTVSPFALIGSLIGFVIGFWSWNPLYRHTIAEAPVVWLPAHLGHGGALALQLAVLAALAAWLWHLHRAHQMRLAAARATLPAAVDTASAAATRPGAASTSAAPHALSDLWSRLWTGRWPYWVGGLAIGLIGALVIVRMSPLGVTATLGSAARSWGQAAGWVPERLDGLDGFAGCSTTPRESLTPNGLLLAGLVAGAFIASLGSDQWTWKRPSTRDAARGLIGGALLGWGSMLGLGCTIGTLLSGGMAGALSAWVFGLSLFATLAIGLGRPWARRHPDHPS